MDKTRLSLIEYSTKHNISISTLRRRIKDKSIDFTEENGKYFIYESSHPEYLNRNTLDIQKKALEKVIESKTLVSNELGFSAAAKMLEELKKAYTQILHEREEQIIQLKEEITDLKTLVKVLESENERLRK
jgi:archaellum component FlaC